MNYENLISNLSKEGAKKPLSKPLQSFAISCLILILYSVILFCFFGIRKDFSSKIHQVYFQIELAISLLTILVSIASVSFLRLPDFSQRKSIKFLPPIFFGILFALLYWQINHVTENHIPCSKDFICFLSIIIFSIAPAAILIFTLRQGIVTNFISSFIAIGIASGSLSYLIGRLIHETENPLHFFIWHFLPTFLVIVLSAFFTKIFTKKL